mmetsp:Transcript_6717/g.21651  ORF Transcript_6717/g.21651 Transcript_6717/m.21651 type:complete len:83 (-) Transcript_6717:28-276(-)
MLSDTPNDHTNVNDRGGSSGAGSSAHRDPSSSRSERAERENAPTDEKNGRTSAAVDADCRSASRRDETDTRRRAYRCGRGPC